jgi:hypothetical protein
MQGDTYGKSAEEIQMENIMGFSGFHQSREKYFEEQSTTLGSVKAGFSPKYDKFFPPKSEFDSPTRKESKETKSRECKWLAIEIKVRNKIENVFNLEGCERIDKLKTMLSNCPFSPLLWILKLQLSINVFYKKCGPKLIFFNEKNLERF